MRRRLQNDSPAWIAPFTDGFFPRFNPVSGDLVCGNETLRLVRESTRQIIAFAVTPNRCARWLDSVTITWQRSTGNDTAQLWWSLLPTPTEIHAATALAEDTVCGNEFAAANGRWSSWLSKGLRLAAGTLHSGAPLETGLYGTQQRGDFLVSSRDAGGMVLVWFKWNQTQRIWSAVSESPPLPDYPQYWLAAPDGTVGVGYYGPAAIILPGGQPIDVTCAPWRQESIPRVCDIDGARYVITSAEYPSNAQPIALVRLLGAAPDRVATVLLPIGFADFDCRAVGDAIELAGASAVGELAILTINPLQLSYGAVIDPGQPPDPPDPKPPDPPDPPTMQKPKITISSYQPTSGDSPLKVKAVYKKESGSGPVDTVSWLYAKDDGSSWQTAATNPGSDPDHTYTLSEAGVWLLAAKATNTAGSHQTGARRAVTVYGGTTPPEPPQPLESNTVAFRTPTGLLLCAENGGGAEVSASRTGDPGIWESFLFEPQPQTPGAWRLRANNGMYLSGDRNVDQLRADRSSAGNWETFFIDEQPDGKIALRNTAGNYVWFDDQGGVHTGGTRIDEQSTFSQEWGIKQESIEPPAFTGGKPSIDQALNCRAEFLAAPGFEWAFMFPGWSEDKQNRYLDWCRQRGQTHLFFAAWGSYGDNPSFDFHADDKWPQFLALVDKVQAAGFVVCFFCITDQVWSGDSFSEDWAHDWIKRKVPDLVSRVRLFVNGWEFPQINGSASNWWTWDGTANLRILKTIRQVVGKDNLVFCHFPPERITGWPSYQHTDNDPNHTEPGWWTAAGSDLDGLLWQDAPDKDEALVVSDCIGGPSLNGTTDIGDCNRIVGEPSTWGLHGKYFIAFEYSRDCDRGERLSREFSVEKKVRGWGNMGYWNGK